MKIARFLSVSFAGLCLFSTGARADPSTSEPNDNPYTQVDPDGVPIAVTQHISQQLTPDQVAAFHKQAQLAAANKNWLIRDYEQQLKMHAAGKSGASQDTNLYYQLSSNKELARLAGLAPLDTDDTANHFQTGASTSGASNVTLRPDTATPGDFAHASLFKPLITPMSSPETAGLHNVYSSLLLSMPAPYSYGFYNQPTAPAPPPIEEDQSGELSDINMPGMVAAKSDLLTDPNSTDLSLDVLPGESVEQARQHQDNYEKMELSLPMDANQLHKEQNAAVNVPSLPHSNNSQTALTTPAPTKPIDDPNAPTPISQTPQITPVRSPIANPYDILNH